jgi:cytochrome c6
MKRFLLIALVALGLTFTGEAIAADGASTFASKCAMCHGKDGSGGTMAPGLMGTDFINGDAAAIKTVILEGRAGKDKAFPKFTMSMPKFKMSDADADALVDYLKGL